MIQRGAKKINTMKINKKEASMWLFLVFMTLPHMKPPYFDHVPALDYLSNVWRLVSFAILIIWALFSKKKISSIVVLIGLREIFLVAVTIFRQGSVAQAVDGSFSVISVIILYEFAINNKITFISSQLFCFELMIYINLFTEIIFPDGLFVTGNEFVHYTNCWLLGLYNTHTQYYFPALLFAWLYKEATGKKIRAYLLLAAILTASIIVWSGGTILSLGLMIIVYVLFKNRTNLFNYYNYWALHIIFFVTIICFRFQNYFIWLIGGILGKWSSLISRMNLWDRVLNSIWEAPIIGNGIWNGVKRILETGVIFGSHAHNMLLEIMYQGGFINLILWVLIIIISGTKINKYRYTSESKIIATAFLGWCVHTLVEPYTSAFLMGMFVIAYHSNRGIEIVMNRVNNVLSVK